MLILVVLVPNSNKIVLDVQIALLLSEEGVFTAHSLEQIQIFTFSSRAAASLQDLPDMLYSNVSSFSSALWVVLFSNKTLLIFCVISGR